VKSNREIVQPRTIILDNFRVQYVLDADKNTLIAKGCHKGEGSVSGKLPKTHWTMEWKFDKEGK